MAVTPESVNALAPMLVRLDELLKWTALIFSLVAKAFSAIAVISSPMNIFPLHNAAPVIVSGLAGSTS